MYMALHNFSDLRRENATLISCSTLISHTVLAFYHSNYKKSIFAKNYTIKKYSTN